MTETRKWVDLYPGKTHEFGTRVRILGHARMNDNAVRLYYEEVHYTAPNEHTGQLAPLQQQILQESEQTTADGYVFDSRNYENVDLRLPGPMLEVESKPKKPEKPKREK